jgi:hypothetical protein
VLCECTQERVKNVSVKYVLVRWSKNIKKPHSVFDDPEELEHFVTIVNKLRHSNIKGSYNATKLKPQMDIFYNLRLMK